MDQRIKSNSAVNGNRFLADTNAFIYLLNREQILQPFIDSTWVYAFITEIELLGKPGLSKSEEKLIRELLLIAEKLQHNDLITELTIQLKQKYRMKLPDAIIAATALVNQWKLISRNVEDFKALSELEIVNPHSL